MKGRNTEEFSAKTLVGCAKIKNFLKPRCTKKFHTLPTPRDTCNFRKVFLELNTMADAPADLKILQNYKT